MTAGLAAQEKANTPPDDIKRVNFDGPYVACASAASLRRTRQLNIGVHFATANPRVAVEFRRALDFWSRVLQLRWRETDAAHCSLAIVDGQPDIFPGATYALGQSPDWSRFSGRIAVDGRIINAVPDDELYATIVHEIAHALGLPHNPDPASIMYRKSEEIHDALYLEATDLALLAERHRLRHHRREPKAVFVIGAAGLHP